MIFLGASDPYEHWEAHLAEVRAYSIHDPIDKAYHDNRSDETRFLTASGRDAARWPIGAASTPRYIGRRLRILVPEAQPYETGLLSVVIDDTGGYLRKRSARAAQIPAVAGCRPIIQIELRFPTHTQAKNFGVKFCTILLDKP